MRLVGLAYLSSALAVNLLVLLKTNPHLFLSAPPTDGQLAAATLAAPSIVTAQDGLTSIELCEAAKRSIEAGQHVAV